MKKGLLFLALLGLILLIAGGAIFAYGIAHNKDEFVSKTYEITDDFMDIEIDVDTSNIELKKSSDGKVKVEVEETTSEPHKVEVKSELSTLVITQEDNRKLHEKLFSFHFKKFSVTIYLPEGAYNKLKVKGDTGDLIVPECFTFSSIIADMSTGDVNIKSDVLAFIEIDLSTGDTSIEGISANAIKVTASTGKISLENVKVTKEITLKASTGKTNLLNVKCDSLEISASTGKVNIEETKINNNLKINVSTGDVNIKNSDAYSIKIKTSTGDVRAILLTSKIFYASSDTGKVSVPPTPGSGTCEVSTSTGDIIITISE